MTPVKFKLYPTYSFQLLKSAYLMVEENEQIDLTNWIALLD
jgi:hypothetical protein